MATGNTKVDVYNLAIDIIKDTALQSVGDSNATARWLNRNWNHAVRTTLRAYPWNFAKKFVSLSADATAPEHTWRYAYKKPPGTLRVLPIRRGGYRTGAPVQHEIVGDYIYTDEPAPLKVVVLIDKSSNPGEWDDLCTEIVRCKLALGMANKFTSKNKFIELASQMLQSATAQAELIDAYEGTPEPIEAFDIIRARGGDEFAIRRLI